MPAHELPGNDPFEQLSSIDSDPVIDRFWQKAKKYELQINMTGGVNSPQLAALLDELNNDWPYYDALVKVSGRAYPNPRHFEEESDIEHDVPGTLWDGRAYFQILSDKQLVSYGVTSVVQLFDDGSPGRVRIVHELYHPEEDEESWGYTMVPDDIMHIDYPWPSYEKITQELRYFYPEIMRQVDEQIPDDCGMEPELLTYLDDFCLVYNPSQEASYPLSQRLCEYIYDRVQFDGMYYRATFRGNAEFIEIREGKYVTRRNTSREHKNALIAIDGIKFTYAPGDATSSDRRHFIHITGYLQSASTEIEPIRVQIPPYVLYGLTPIRTEHCDPEIW